MSTVSRSGGPSSLIGDDRHLSALRRGAVGHLQGGVEHVGVGHRLGQHGQLVAVAQVHAALHLELEDHGLARADRHEGGV